MKGKASTWVRVRWSGKENPRGRYEAPDQGMIHDARERQLRDEVRSGGTQPAYISMIHRRLETSCSVPNTFF